MKEKEFNKIVKLRCQKIVDILAKKGAEYSSDNDRLHHYKVASRILNCTNEKALLAQFTKHLVSILDIIDKIDDGQTPTNCLIEEKIGDAVNYLVLLECVLKERLFKEEEHLFGNQKIFIERLKKDGYKEIINKKNK